MIRSHLSRTLTLFVLVAFLSVGCFSADESTTSTQTDEGLSQLGFNSQALELEDGAMNKDDEHPNFADAKIKSGFPETKRPTSGTEDIIKKDAAVTSAERSLGGVFVRIIWGKLTNKPESAERTDFSGSISVKGAAVKVLRVIRFEKHNDKYDRLLPRTNRSVVTFESLTFSHNDGVLLKVIALPGDDAPKVLQFNTKAFKFSLPLTDLPLHKVMKVDDLGTRVAIVVFKKRPGNKCPKGFVRGAWKRKGERGGVFGGLIMAHNGRKIGHLRGIWGKKKDGKRVFFGKLIAKDGKFRGVMKGVYQPNEEGTGGHFKGKIYNRNKKVKGVIAGRYRKSDGIDGGGHFQGMWKRICAGLACKKAVELEVDVEANTCAEDKPEPEDRCDDAPDSIDRPCAPIEPKPIHAFCCKADGDVDQLNSTDKCDGKPSDAQKDARSACRPDAPNPFVSGETLK